MPETISGFTVIGFSSISIGGTGTGVGVGYSVFGNYVGGGISLGPSKFIFLHDIINNVIDSIIKTNIKFLFIK
ncbi:hypothetical protein [uncultured Brachyspira sp.]|uniref:hypothetical protein n=1 Tax=uncultured Brachyspira sp. TaxID=221953 RepID=UPI00345BF65F